MTTPLPLKLPRRRLLTFDEPRLLFAHGQKLIDPKDGLMLFGPPEKPTGTRFGVIGTKEGIRQLTAWCEKIRRAVPAEAGINSSVAFPGFETVFRTDWNPTPRVTLTVDEKELSAKVHNLDAYQRVYDTVSLFADPIKRFVEEEDPKVAFWFVVIPEEVWKLCRPESTVTRKDGVKPDVQLRHSKALELLDARDLFEEVNIAAEKHLFENHFHNQLKARLLSCEAVTQIVRQTTLAPQEYLNKKGKPKRRLQDDATVAWNLTSAIYYKAGAKPWTLADIRDGVCYIGLVFKHTHNPKDPKEACCGAQMFLHTGEGIIFKGAVGSWETEKAGDFHLNEEKAEEIVRDCIEAYKKWHDAPPKELFIHGKTRFNKEEIDGFRKGAGDVEVTGIQIQRPNDLKLFREGRRAVLRDVALKIDKRNAFVWTSGYVPKLLTYPGREVPSPLKVKIVFGKTVMEQVIADIIALTKVNFNTCIFGDGIPVTLRFAEDVGEILTAIPELKPKPLLFRHFI